MKLFFKILRYAILVGIIVLAISRLAPHFSDFNQIWDLKDKINYGWIFAALFAQVFQYIGDGWLSQLLLQIVGIHMNMKDTFRIASINVFAAQLLPVGEAGGLAAAYHFYKKLGVHPEKFIFLAICWTGITHVLLILLFIVPTFFLPELPIAALNTSLIIITFAVIAVIIAIIYLFRKKLFHKMEKWLGKYNWAKPFFTFIRNRKIYGKLLKSHPWLLFLGLLASLIYYAANIATLSFSFLAFGIMPSLSLIIFTYAASLIFSKITLAPAGIGASEATLILIFLAAHVDPKITIGAVIIYRLITFWLPIPAGSYSYYSLKKETNKKIKLREN